MSTGLSRRRKAGADDGAGANGRGAGGDSATSAVGAAHTAQPLLTLLEEVVLIGLKDKEGYLSFWNDNISYALRGTILMELALRGRVRMVMDPNRRRFELADRLIEVLDPTPTGETLLDEALGHIRSEPENLSVASWIDYLSGETWNLLKVSYHLKQVRERLSKGLVDKGVLRTEMKSFLLFDMATHPLEDVAAKRQVVRRILAMLTDRSLVLEHNKYFAEDVEWAHVRAVALVAACSAANVLENVLAELNFEQRDKAFVRAEELLEQYADYPFGTNASAGSGGSGVGTNVLAAVQAEAEAHGAQAPAALELVAAVVSIFAKMDAIL